MKKLDIHSISSCSNPLIKSICGLRLGKNREKTNHFIFEGSKLFAEACDWHIPVTHILVTDNWFERSTPALRIKLEHSAADVILVSESVMSKCSSQKQPEGILCCADQIRSDFPEDPQAVVILENVRDPGNVGTIIRTADAAGYSAVMTTSGTADCFNEKVIRASMGSVFHLPVIQHLSGIEIIKKLKHDGFRVIGSSLTGEEEYFQSPPSDKKKAVILGNESSGMSFQLQQECDYLVKIPMYGHAESLNVSVAAGLMLYKFR